MRTEHTYHLISAKRNDDECQQEVSKRQATDDPVWERP